LQQAGKEKHIEDKSDDASRKDNLLPSDEDGCGTVWDAIYKNKKQPEYA
jgi:hypothetical protein